MDKALDRAVRDRAESRCEYCRIAEGVLELPFPLDHVMARQHGGPTTAANLALACPMCNYHKGTNLTGVDPLAGEVTLLFHPRRQRWSDHFAWGGLRIVGRTATGRTRVALLKLNADDRLRLRALSPPPLKSPRERGPSQS